jgi:hypothetical protein
MSKREQLKQIKRETTKTKINKNLYASSIFILILTTIINIINIFYSPYLLNGLILEINIAIIIYCIYSYIKLKKKISFLKDKELDLRIQTILYNE